MQIYLQGPYIVEKEKQLNRKMLKTIVNNLFPLVLFVF